MWLYLSLLLLPPSGAAATHLAGGERRTIHLAIAGILVVLIGLRYHVGCDWNTYLLMSLRADRLTLPEALTLNDPGYMLVNWVSAQVGLGVAAVNTLCAAILMTGLTLLCRDMPRQWLALFITMPTLILIVGFSATRQSVAVGLFMLSLHLLLKHRRHWAVIPLLVVAGTFHESAFVLVPLVLLMRLRPPQRAVTALGVLAVVGACGVLLLLMLPRVAEIVARHPPSAGAWLRALPMLLALVAFPLVWRRAELTQCERSVMFWLGAFTVACLAGGIASPFAMDRLGFYTLPFQLMVLTRIVDVPQRAAALLSALVAFPYFLLFIGWLTFGTTAACAIPYRTFLSQPEMLALENTRTAFKFNHITDSWGPLRPLVAQAVAKANSPAAQAEQPGMIVE